MELSRTIETETGEMIVKRVSVPLGLEELMEGLAKEVILRKPKDIYIFASEYFTRLLHLRDSGHYRGCVRSAKLAVKRPSKAAVVGRSAFSPSDSNNVGEKNIVRKPSTPYYLNQSNEGAITADEKRRASIREHLRKKREEFSVNESNKNEKKEEVFPRKVKSMHSSGKSRSASRENQSKNYKEKGEYTAATTFDKESRKSSSEREHIISSRKTRIQSHSKLSKSIDFNDTKRITPRRRTSSISSKMKESSEDKFKKIDSRNASTIEVGSKMCGYDELNQSTESMKKSPTCVEIIASSDQNRADKSKHLTIEKDNMSAIQDESGQYEVSYSPTELVSGITKMKGIAPCERANGNAVILPENFENASMKNVALSDSQTAPESFDTRFEKPYQHTEESDTFEIENDNSNKSKSNLDHDKPGQVEVEGDTINNHAEYNPNSKDIPSSNIELEKAEVQKGVESTNEVTKISQEISFNSKVVQGDTSEKPRITGNDAEDEPEGKELKTLEKSANQNDPTGDEGNISGSTIFIANSEEIDVLGKPVTAKTKPSEISDSDIPTSNELDGDESENIHKAEATSNQVSYGDGDETEKTMVDYHDSKISTYSDSKQKNQVHDSKSGTSPKIDEGEMEADGLVQNNTEINQTIGSNSNAQNRTDTYNSIELTKGGENTSVKIDKLEGGEEKILNEYILDERYQKKPQQSMKSTDGPDGNENKDFQHKQNEIADDVKEGKVDEILNSSFRTEDLDQRVEGVEKSGIGSEKSDTSEQEEGIEKTQALVGKNNIDFSNSNKLNETEIENLEIGHSETTVPKQSKDSVEASEQTVSPDPYGIEDKKIQELKCLPLENKNNERRRDEGSMEIERNENISRDSNHVNSEILTNSEDDHENKKRTESSNSDEYKNTDAKEVCKVNKVNSDSLLNDREDTKKAEVFKRTEAISNNIEENCVAETKNGTSVASTKQIEGIRYKEQKVSNDFRGDVLKNNDCLTEHKQNDALENEKPVVTNNSNTAESNEPATACEEKNDDDEALKQNEDEILVSYSIDETKTEERENLKPEIPDRIDIKNENQIHTNTGKIENSNKIQYLKPNDIRIGHATGDAETEDNELRGQLFDGNKLNTVEENMNNKVTARGTSENIEEETGGIEHKIFGDSSEGQNKNLDLEAGGNDINEQEVEDGEHSILNVSSEEQGKANEENIVGDSSEEQVRTLETGEIQNEITEDEVRMKEHKICDEALEENVKTKRNENDKENKNSILSNLSEEKGRTIETGGSPKKHTIVEESSCENKTNQSSNEHKLNATGAQEIHDTQSDISGVTREDLNGDEKAHNINTSNRAHDIKDESVNEVTHMEDCKNIFTKEENGINEEKLKDEDPILNELDRNEGEKIARKEQNNKLNEEKISVCSGASQEDKNDEDPKPVATSAPLKTGKKKYGHLNKNEIVDEVPDVVNYDASQNSNVNNGINKEQLNDETSTGELAKKLYNYDLDESNLKEQTFNALEEENEKEKTETSNLKCNTASISNEESGPMKRNISNIVDNEDISKTETNDEIDYHRSITIEASSKENEDDSLKTSLFEMKNEIQNCEEESKYSLNKNGELGLRIDDEDEDESLNGNNQNSEPTESGGAKTNRDAESISDQPISGSSSVEDISPRSKAERAFVKENNQINLLKNNSADDEQACVENNISTKSSSEKAEILPSKETSHDIDSALPIADEEENISTKRDLDSMKMPGGFIENNIDSVKSEESDKDAANVKSILSKNIEHSSVEEEKSVSPRKLQKQKPVETKIPSRNGLVKNTSFDSVGTIDDRKSKFGKGRSQSQKIIKPEPNDKKASRGNMRRVQSQELKITPAIKRERRTSISPEKNPPEKESRKLPVRTISPRKKADFFNHQQKKENGEGMSKNGSLVRVVPEAEAVAPLLLAGAGIIMTKNDTHPSTTRNPMLHSESEKLMETEENQQICAHLENDKPMNASAVHNETSSVETETEKDNCTNGTEDPSKNLIDEFDGTTYEKNNDIGERCGSSEDDKIEDLTQNGADTNHEDSQIENQVNTLQFEVNTENNNLSEGQFHPKKGNLESLKENAHFQDENSVSETSNIHSTKDDESHNAQNQEDVELFDTSSSDAKIYQNSISNSSLLSDTRKNSELRNITPEKEENVSEKSITQTDEFSEIKKVSKLTLLPSQINEPKTCEVADSQADSDTIAESCSEKKTISDDETIISLDVDNAEADTHNKSASKNTENTDSEANTRLTRNEHEIYSEPEETFLKLKRPEGHQLVPEPYSENSESDVTLKKGTSQTSRTTGIQENLKKISENFEQKRDKFDEFSGVGNTLFETNNSLSGTTNEVISIESDNTRSSNCGKILRDTENIVQIPSKFEAAKIAGISGAEVSHISSNGSGAKQTENENEMEKDSSTSPKILADAQFRSEDFSAENENHTTSDSELNTNQPIPSFQDDISLAKEILSNPLTENEEEKLTHEGKKKISPIEEHEINRTIMTKDEKVKQESLGNEGESMFDQQKQASGGLSESESKKNVNDSQTSNGDSNLTSTQLNENLTQISSEINSAIHIQTVWRGYQARKMLKNILQKRSSESKQLPHLHNKDVKGHITDENKNLIDIENENQKKRSGSLVPSKDDGEISSTISEVNTEGENKTRQKRSLIEKENEPLTDNNEKRVDDEIGSKLFSSDDIRAAVKIQSTFRGFRTRKAKYSRKNQSFDQNNDIGREYVNQALKIQSAWRAYKVRKNIRDVEEKINEMEHLSGNELPKSIHLSDGEILKAVTKIQAGLRGYMARKQVKSIRERYRSLDEIKEESNGEINSLNQKSESLSDDKILEALKQLDSVFVPDTLPKLSSEDADAHKCDEKVSKVEKSCVSEEKPKSTEVSLQDRCASDELLDTNSTNPDRDCTSNNLKGTDIKDARTNNSNDVQKKSLRIKSLSSGNLQEYISEMETHSAYDEASDINNLPDANSANNELSDVVQGKLKKSKATDDLLKLAEQFEVNDTIPSEDNEKYSKQSASWSADLNRPISNNSKNEEKTELMSEKLATFEIPGSDESSEGKHESFLGNDVEVTDHQNVVGCIGKVENIRKTENVEFQNAGNEFSATNENSSNAPDKIGKKDSIDNKGVTVEHLIEEKKAENKTEASIPEFNDTEEEKNVEENIPEDKKEDKGEADDTDVAKTDGYEKVSSDTRIKRDVQVEIKTGNNSQNIKPENIFPGAEEKTENMQKITKSSEESAFSNEQTGIRNTVVTTEVDKNSQILGTIQKDHVRNNNLSVESSDMPEKESSKENKVKIVNDISIRKTRSVDGITSEPKIGDEKTFKAVSLTNEFENGSNRSVLLGEKDAENIKYNQARGTNDHNFPSETFGGLNINETESNPIDVCNDVLSTKDSITNKLNDSEDKARNEKRPTLTDFMKKTLDFTEMSLTEHTNKNNDPDKMAAKDSHSNEDEVVMKNTKEKRSRYEAATRIQSVYRGFRDRKRVKSLKKERKLVNISPENDVKVKSDIDEIQRENDTLNEKQVGQTSAEQLTQKATNSSKNHPLSNEDLSEQSHISEKGESVNECSQTNAGENVDSNEADSRGNVPAGAEILTTETQHRINVVDASSDVESKAQPSIQDSYTQEVLSNKSRAESDRGMESAKRNNSTLRNKNMEAEAATKIQAGFRGYQVRKQLKMTKPSSGNTAKKTVRRKSSGRITDNQAKKQKENIDLVEKSAVKIQAGIRGFLARRRVKKPKSSEESS